MKNIIILLTFLWSITSYAVAPYGIKGQQQSATLYSNVHQFPNNQVTNLGGINALVETGNTNILSNPSFEHSTFSTSWTNSAGTFTQETSVVIDGKASAKLVLAAQTMSLTQSSTLYASQFADGVQGLAMVRIKSNIALSVCSIQAGTVSTTNCVTTATDSKWGLYKVPFILGATSNGISIASTGSVTGTVYIDDAFVGAVDLKQDVAGGFVTILNATGNSGIALTANVTDIPFTEVIDTTNSYNGTTFTVPETAAYSISVAVQYTTSVSRGILLYINGTYTKAITDNINQSFNQGSYTATFTKGQVLSFRTSAAGTISNVTDAHYLTISQGTPSSQIYTATCGANCVDVFSAFVSDGVGTTTVSQENVDFINGACTNPSAGLYVCTFNSGIFTVAPNCTANATSWYGVSVVTTSTTATFGFKNDVGTLTDANFSLVCQKEGADFVATRTIQGTFNEVDVSTGISRPKTCHYAFGGAAATLASPTECTTGTCVETYDSCGTGSPPAWFTTSFYESVTFSAGTWANSSYIRCSCVAWDVTANQVRGCDMYKNTPTTTWLTDTSGGAVVAQRTSDGSATQATAYVQLTCTGSAP